MDGSSMLEWTRVLGPVLLSWPLVGLMVFLMLRQPLQRLLDRWLSGEGASAEIGPVKIALGTLVRDGQKTVTDLSRLNTLMAESRLLELEITERNFGGSRVLSEEQRSQLSRHIEEFRRLIGSATGA